MLPFLLLNIIVSAAVVLAMLYWWEGRGSGAAPVAEATADTTLATPALSDAATLDAFAQSTAAPAGTGEGPTVHTVAAGETLGSISTTYDVAMEDIMEANGLTDPNFLQVGQQLIIPIEGLMTPTPPATATATVSALPSPIATEPLVQGEVIITIQEVVGMGQLAEEAVQIANLGSRPVSLAGWQLREEGGNEFTFGQVTLFGDGAALLVHTETGQDGVADLYWGLEQPIWESGESVRLLDAEGTLQATMEVP
jgi:LysM repeat protein